MNLSNPLEITLTVFLVILSVFIVERIIARAFKTVVIAIIIAGGFLAYTEYFHKENIKKSNEQYQFTFHDLVDSTSFVKKFNFYKKEVKDDVIKDYLRARRNINQ